RAGGVSDAPRLGDRQQGTSVRSRCPKPPRAEVRRGRVMKLEPTLPRVREGMIMAKKYHVAVIGWTGKGNYGHGLDVDWKALVSSCFSPRCTSARSRKVGSTDAVSPRRVQSTASRSRWRL